MAGFCGCRRQAARPLILKLSYKKFDYLKLKDKTSGFERKWTGVRLRQFCKMLDGITFFRISEEREESFYGYRIDFYFGNQKVESLTILDPYTILFDGQVYQTDYHLDLTLMKQLGVVF